MTAIRVSHKDKEGKRHRINLTLSTVHRDFARINNAIERIGKTQDGEDSVKMFLFDLLAEGFKSMNHDVDAWISEEKNGRYIGLDEDTDAEILTKDLIGSSQKKIKSLREETQNEQQDKVSENIEDSSSDKLLNILG